MFRRPHDSSVEIKQACKMVADGGIFDSVLEQTVQLSDDVPTCAVLREHGFGLCQAFGYSLSQRKEVNHTKLPFLKWLSRFLLAFHLLYRLPLCSQNRQVWLEVSLKNSMRKSLFSSQMMLQRYFSGMGWDGHGKVIQHFYFCKKYCVISMPSCLSMMLSLHSSDHISNLML